MKHKHIILVRPGTFGDDPNLDIHGIGQMENITDYIITQIIKKQEISKYQIFHAQGIKVAWQSSEIFVKRIPLRSKNIDQEFLRRSTEEKPAKILKRILEETKTFDLVIMVAQSDNLSEIPKLMLEFLNKDPSKFMQFAMSPSNFQEKRGVHIAIGEDGEIHGIYQV